MENRTPTREKLEIFPSAPVLASTREFNIIGWAQRVPFGYFQTDTVRWAIISTYMSLPSWIDSTAYPFEPKRFTTPAGTLRYLDEGKGKPIVMVHGNPTWSFLYRHAVKDLRDRYRCVVPDHIGFGLSDKPRTWSYLPKDHAQNLDALLESLDLRDITLVVGDWGGPIGLSYALAHPDRIKNIVITNTWCWPVHRDWYYIGFSLFVGGPIGRWLIQRFNFFVSVILRMAFGDKKKLTPLAYRHYRDALRAPEDRQGCWTFPRQIIGSTPWLRDLRGRLSVLAKKNITLLWGMKDIAFREKELMTWIKIFPDARVIRYADAGHFIPEERPEDFLEELKRVLEA